MSIRIDKGSCIGCGACTEACPGNLLSLGDDRKAVISDVRDCWGCTACMKDCPVSAIHYFLGADIGGAGTEMTIAEEGNIYRWTFTFPDGRQQEIDVDRTSSNKY